MVRATPSTVCGLMGVVNAPLSYGNPESVGLLSAPLQELNTNVSAYEVAQNCLLPSLSLKPSRDSLSLITPDSSASHNAIHPLYPGATLLIGHRNVIVSHYSAGYSLLYADSNGTYLPDSERIKVLDDSIYDMVRPLSCWCRTVLMTGRVGEFK